MFFSKVAIASASLFFARYASATPACARSYTVQSGDWCDTISAAKNVSTYQLAVTNIDKIDKNCDNLQVGDSLCLGYVGQDCSNTYVVKANDLCDVIASNHNINSTTLMLNNPQINADCDNIYIGEVLCIGGTVAVPALPSGSPVPAATPPPGAVPANPTATPAKATTTAAPTPTPTPAADDDEDDDDCIDEDEDDTTTTTAAPMTTTTKAATTTTTTTSASATPTDDGDDEDLPWCDEL